VPAATFVHEKLYGDDKSVFNKVAPLKNSTLITEPLASAAVADKLTVAGALPKTVGAANVIVGAVFPEVLTVILNKDDVVTAF
jgi:hypothetical protein